jgi:hypothetical protein
VFVALYLLFSGDVLRKHSNANNEEVEVSNGDGSVVPKQTKSFMAPSSNMYRKFAVRLEVHEYNGTRPNVPLVMTHLHSIRHG